MEEAQAQFAEEKAKARREPALPQGAPPGNLAPRRVSPVPTLNPHRRRRRPQAKKTKKRLVAERDQLAEALEKERATYEPLKNAAEVVARLQAQVSAYDKQLAAARQARA